MHAWTGRQWAAHVGALLGFIMLLWLLAYHYVASGYLIAASVMIVFIFLAEFIVGDATLKKVAWGLGIGVAALIIIGTTYNLITDSSTKTTTTADGVPKRSGIAKVRTTTKEPAAAPAKVTTASPCDGVGHSIRPGSGKTAVDPDFGCQFTFEVRGGCANLGESDAEDEHVMVCQGDNVGNIFEEKGVRPIYAWAHSGKPILNYVLCPHGTASGWKCLGKDLASR